MAMVACRLFNRARQLYAPKVFMPSLLIAKCTKYAYSGMEVKEDDTHLFKFIKPNDLRGTKGKLPKKIDEEMWNFRRYRAEQDAREGGSPFFFTIPVDHVSTDNATSISLKENHIIKGLRLFQSIKFDTTIDYLLVNRFVREEHGSADEIRNIAMKYLYVLTLQEVIPSEKLYMDYLIDEFNHWELVDQWWNEDYVTLLEPYSELFTMLPEHCLKRGLQLHMSRIPYKYSEKSLGKVLKKEMLRKLEKDYNLLTSKIHDLPSISEAMMVREIKSLVDKRNVGYYKQDAFERRSHIFFERSYQ